MNEPVSAISYRDYLLLAVFCLVLFGYSVFNGRPLTMHEARLPQTAREMQQNGNWLLPQSGGRPWLERPPLPHWVVVGFTAILGQHTDILVVRLPSALAGLVVVLLTAWMAGGWFGRVTGLLSGYVLASCYEFWQYSTLAEDDIYLALLVMLAMAIFVRCEWWNDQRSYATRTNPVGPRAWSIILLFVITGLTNLTKGPLLGNVIIASTLCVFLIWEMDGKRLLRYVWFPGWLITIGLTIAWPILAWMRYPDVIDNWKYDYLGRMSGSYSAINQPAWFYLLWLPIGLLPWAPAGVTGLIVSWKQRASEQAKAFRLLYCWAIVPVILFSIPSGKHHHYLLPMLAPWAILIAVGLQHWWSLLKARWPDAHGSAAMRNASILLLIAYSAGISLFGARSDKTQYDTRFARNAASQVPTDQPLYINADLGPPGNLDFFRLQFYSRSSARLLHNLTFLRDERITAPEVYVIARARDQAKLETMGQVKLVVQSEKSHDDESSAGRFSLFRLHYDPNRSKYPVPDRITNMQGLMREKGPFCGPEF